MPLLEGFSERLAFPYEVLLSNELCEVSGANASGKWFHSIYPTVPARLRNRNWTSL